MSDKSLVIMETETAAEDDRRCVGVTLEDPADYDYFSQPLIAGNIWPMIFSFAPFSEQMPARYASPIFDDMLGYKKAEVLFPDVVGVLIKTKYLPPSTILQYRYVSKKVKENIDNTLTQQEPTWINKAFAFYDTIPPKKYHLAIEGLRQRLRRFETLLYEYNGNPFITNRIAINIKVTEDMFHNICKLLEGFGHYLHKVVLSLFFQRNPSSQMEFLILTMKQLPNIRSLSLTLPNHIDNLNFELLPTEEFPSLPSLSELSIYIEKFRDLETDDRMQPSNAFINSFLRVYGPQLKTLVIPPNYVAGSDRQVHFLNTDLSNLQHLEILPNCDDPWYSYHVYDALLKLSLPNLESLTHGDMDFEEFDEAFPFTLTCARSAIRMSRFAKTALLDKIRDQQEQQHGTHLGVGGFPKLKKLRVCTSKDDCNSGIWDVCSHRFTELQEILFQPTLDGHCDQHPEIPEINVLNNYFNMFSKLQKITWGRRPWHMGNCVKTVFTRRGTFQVVVPPGGP